MGRRQVLDEFIECIVRVAFEKDPLKHLSDFKDGVPTVRTNRRPKFRSALVFCLLRDLTAVWIDPTLMDTVILGQTVRDGLAFRRVRLLVLKLTALCLVPGSGAAARDR